MSRPPSAARRGTTETPLLGLPSSQCAGMENVRPHPAKNWNCHSARVSELEEGRARLLNLMRDKCERKGRGGLRRPTEGPLSGPGPSFSLQPGAVGKGGIVKGGRHGKAALDEPTTPGRLTWPPLATASETPDSRL